VRTRRSLPDHPHRQLLRQARPEAVPDGARRVRARGRRGALRRRAHHPRPRVGGDARSRRPAGAAAVRLASPRTRVPARLRGAPAPASRSGRPRGPGGAGEDLRVPSRRAADPCRGAADQRRRAPDPRVRARCRRRAGRRRGDPRGAEGARGARAGRPADRRAPSRRAPGANLPPQARAGALRAFAEGRLSSVPFSDSQGISGGAWRRQAASSVAPISTDMDAPCVLPWPPQSLPRNARPSQHGTLMPSRRLTDFLLFAAVFTMSFEKLYWNVAGKIALSEVLSILFVGAYLFRRLGRHDTSLPRTSGIVIAF